MKIFLYHGEGVYRMGATGARVALTSETRYTGVRNASLSKLSKENPVSVEIDRTGLKLKIQVSETEDGIELKGQALWKEEEKKDSFFEVMAEKEKAAAKEGIILLQRFVSADVKAKEARYEHYAVRVIISVETIHATNFDFTPYLITYASAGEDNETPDSDAEEDQDSEDNEPGDSSEDDEENEPSHDSEHASPSETAQVLLPFTHRVYGGDRAGIASIVQSGDPSNEGKAFFDPRVRKVLDKVANTKNGETWRKVLSYPVYKRGNSKVPTELWEEFAKEGIRGLPGVPDKFVMEESTKLYEEAVKAYLDAGGSKSCVDKALKPDMDWKSYGCK
jgi:hypothetical protein